MEKIVGTNGEWRREGITGSRPHHFRKGARRFSEPSSKGSGYVSKKSSLEKARTLFIPADSVSCSIPPPPHGVPL